MMKNIMEKISSFLSSKLLEYLSLQIDLIINNWTNHLRHEAQSSVDNEIE